MAETPTLVDRRSEVEGQLRGQDARIEGRFRGEIALAGRLETSEGSQVEARLEAEVAEIAGEFRGEIATRRLVLLEKSRVQATVVVKVLVMREGARLDGAVTASGEPARGPDPRAQAPGPAQTPGLAAPRPVGKGGGAP
ncbi:MAG: polymer-forming cytoskeletal protein [Vicinamibacteria bacterium]